MEELQPSDHTAPREQINYPQNSAAAQAFLVHRTQVSAAISSLHFHVLGASTVLGQVLIAPAKILFFIPKEATNA
jgi:hypothetical protein